LSPYTHNAMLFAIGYDVFRHVFQIYPAHSGSCNGVYFLRGSRNTAPLHIGHLDLAHGKTAGMPHLSIWSVGARILLLNSVATTQDSRENHGASLMPAA
jgi:hypothetical protein